MALILVVIGAVLYYTKRFNFGGVQTEGRHVRAAGLVLVFPAIFTFVLSFFAGMIFARSEAAVITLFNIMAAVEIISMVLAVAVAYILLANPQNAPRLPGILGDIQRERQNNPDAAPTPSAPRRPTMQPAQPVREEFPSVLTVAQAARYMQITEAQIIDLIDSGQLAAARINYNYRIAKSNLDDLLAARPTATNV